MALATFFGRTTDFFYDAFGNPDATPLSFSPTTIVLLDSVSDFTSILTGTNFVQASSETTPVTGTLNGFSVVDSSGELVMTANGFAWDMATFSAALDTLFEDDDSGPLEALFSQQPLTVDAVSAVDGLDFRYPDVTSMLTLLGSDFGDSLQGGQGDDSITPGASDRGEWILGSPGDDTIDFIDHSATAWAEIDYGLLALPVTVHVDGTDGTMRIDKGTNGTDTVLEVGNVLQGDGLNVVGTIGDDVFNIEPGDGGWAKAVGGAGDDTYNLTLTGDVRLAFHYGPGSEFGDGSVTLNLATGLISDDGFGGQDTITLSGDGRLEIETWDLDDNLTGSDRDESFILGAGNDTLDAGGGFDRLRYDRSDVQNGINADLAAGTVTGTWDDIAFTHTVSGVDWIRGAQTGADTMFGAAADEVFDGYGGNDSLAGQGGNDSLYGGDGNDTLRGGNGTDQLSGWSGDDLLDPGSNSNYDDVNPGSGNDTIEAGSMTSGYLHVGHYDIRTDTALVVNVDGSANTAVIDKGTLGSTTILDVRNPMDMDGIGFEGSDLADTFNFTVSNNGWLMGRGGGGNDTFNLGSNPNATGGQVRLDYMRHMGDAAGQGAVVDLATGIVSNDGFGGQDAITGVGNVYLEIRGSDLNDDLTGSEFGESLIGKQGDDRVDGGGGNDYLEGGDGTDTVIGGVGNDRIYGGDTEADLRDVVYGGAGDDFVEGGYGNDELRGDGDNDTLNGGFGADTMIGGTGNDEITGAAWGDVLFGGDGDDFINGGFGFDRVNGGSGADRFFHTGNAGHGSDWIQDYAAAEGDLLVYGTAAQASDFLVQRATTPSAGADGVQEVFVTHISSGVLLWALVDGDAQTSLNVQAAGQVFDLLA